MRRCSQAAVQAAIPRPLGKLTVYKNDDAHSQRHWYITPVATIRLHDGALSTAAWRCEACSTAGLLPTRDPDGGGQLLPTALQFSLAEAVAEVRTSASVSIAVATPPLP